MRINRSGLLPPFQRNTKTITKQAGVDLRLRHGKGGYDARAGVGELEWGVNFQMISQAVATIRTTSNYYCIFIIIL
jgi:hypothetical protein